MKSPKPVRPELVYAALVAASWEKCKATTIEWLTTEDPFCIAKLWAANTLLQVGWRTQDPVIRGVFDDTVAFVQQHEDRKAAFERTLQQGDQSVDYLADESTTGLLGAAIYLWHQLGKRELVQLWTPFFLESLSWNLSKDKTLSFRTNVNLLLAASVGLASISREQQTETLRSDITGYLRQISKAATIIELLEVTQSLESLDAREQIPKEPIRLVCNDRIQNGSTEDNIIGLLLLEKLGDLWENDAVKHEVALLNSLRRMGQIESVTEPQIWLYCFLLPWLYRRVSKQSLFGAWEQHKGQGYRLAQTLNYMLAYVLLTLVVTWAAYQLSRSWLIQQPQNRLVLIVVGYFTVWFDILLFVIDRIVQVYGKEFWGKNSVKLIIGVINAILALVALTFR